MILSVFDLCFYVGKGVYF